MSLELRLIGLLRAPIVRAAGGARMRWRVGAALGLLLIVSGCGAFGGGTSHKCPKPIHYDDATEKKIEKAREALPRDSILQQVLIDYENERDDLRFCQ